MPGENKDKVKNDKNSVARKKLAFLYFPEVSGAQWAKECTYLHTHLYQTITRMNKEMCCFFARERDVTFLSMDQGGIYMSVHIMEKSFRPLSILVKS